MKIQVTHLFEDTGFCKDVFQSVSEPRFYINRDSETGEWYTATPVYYENDSRVRTDVVIEILLDGEAVALDGNADSRGIWENWVYDLDSGRRREQVTENAHWMGQEYYILAVQETHRPTGFVFTNFRLRAANQPAGSASCDLLLYDWQTHP